MEAAFPPTTRGGGLHAGEKMNDVNFRIAQLSPAKRALLEQRLKQKAVNANGQEGIGIKKRAKQNSAPLSSAQTRMWLLDQLEPDNPAYNRPSNIQLTGTLNVVALEKSLNEIVRRHEVLRTSFRASEGQLFQEIVPTYTLTLPIVDLCYLSSEERNNEVQRLATEEAQRPFDLSRLPLVRATLLRLGEGEHILLLTLHHIIFDGWSMGVLLRELATVYEAFCSGKPSPLPELPIQYADFAHWQQQRLQGDLLESQLGYWKEQLSGDLPVLELPTDRPRAAVQTNRGARQYLLLPKNLSESLKDLSRTEGVTLFMTLLAAFQILLHRYTGQEDIIVGSPIAGRDRQETENLIGVFINTLVLRTLLDGNPNFQELLSRVREVATGAIAHQDLPFEKLVEELQPERGLSHTPLFQVLFQLRNVPQQAVEVQGLNFQEFQFERGIAAFDLTLDIVEEPEGLSCVFAYNIDLFDAGTITRMAGHFQTLLEGIVANPLHPISQLPLLTEAELHQLLVSWNNTSADYPSNLSIHELFETQVKRTPDAVAVVFEDKHLTYGELNARANQLAHYLRSLGVKPEVLVGICLERSVEMIVGLLGILKAGGAYVPLDPAYPTERNSFILSDARVQVLLTSEKLVAELLMPGVSVVCLDRDWEILSDQSEENPFSGSVASNLAYVIYTSGSMGQPKGVTIEHRSVLNLAAGLNKAIYTEGHDDKRRVSLNGSLAFDTSVKQIVQLFGGHTLDIVPQELRFDGSALLSYLGRHEIDVFDCTPSQLRLLIEAGMLSNSAAAPKYVLVGGEPIDESTWQELVKAENISFYNLYGPTECTVDATVCHMGLSGERPVIGRAIANTQIYILDPDLQPVPIGVPGELHIGGAGLARGYLNRPELTQEKFIPNPFNKSKVKNQKSKLYKTGDLARYLPNGDIEFLGRIDNQVKIRGFRIELGEIESLLSTHDQIQQAVVIAREDVPGDKRLVAYLVTSSESLTSSQLRQFLKQKLPEYTLPSAFVLLENLPLTPNGKVDRRALPAPEGELIRVGEYVAPRTPNEEIIAYIFAVVLNRENVGIHDNFFELGGHSLLATQLVSRVRETLSVELPLSTVFSSPTVAGLNQTITDLRTTQSGLTLPPIEPQQRNSEQFPLSWAQERLWFIDQLESGSATYNIPLALRLVGNVNVKALEQALCEIVRRHEVLRTSFPSNEGKPTQVINPEANLLFKIIDLSNPDEAERNPQLQPSLQQEINTPFNLATGPLIRSNLWQISSSEYVLLVKIHHIVADGWSIGVFRQELSSLYQAFLGGEPSPLPELPIQYRDFALWQREWLSGEILENQLNYWKQQLQGAPELLQLPTDRPRPSIQTYQGGNFSFSLSEELSKELKTLSHRSGTTLFMTLVGGFATLLYRLCGQSDILIGSPVANRNRSEIEDLIGFFVNTLVLRTSLEDNPSFTELLTQVRETTLKAYEHQELGFEQIVEALQPERSLSHSPLFQVMFVLQNTPTGELELPGVSVKPLKLKTGIAKFDLTLSMRETESGLVGSWNYNTDLFDGETISRMAGHFQTLLSAIVENPQQRVGELPLLTQAERDRLLVEWNQTESEYPQDKCIHQLFEEQVERTPDAVAVVFENQQLTYQQLNQRANQLAHHLLSLGVGPEVLVGICVERSLEMVVGLLAILKAGGVYLPLDPAYPQERVTFMLKDSQASVIVTQNSLIANLQKDKAKIINLDRNSQEIETQAKCNPQSLSAQNNLAYVIYTSGSTGTPKGVLIEHRAISCHCQTIVEHYQLTQCDRILQFASVGFDASLEQILPTLIVGATLILSETKFLTGLDFNQKLQELGLTVVNLPPAYWNQWLQSLEDNPSAIFLERLRLVICGGEEISSESLKLWQKSPMRSVRLLNAYGPTETTITAMTFEVSQGSSLSAIPIGRPLKNRKVYILDSSLQPVPISVPGELHIGGDGLARGYFKRPKLNGEKFIPNPFNKSKVKSQKSKLLYKTGDLARYLPDGNIEFLGRLDNQVKIRGFRIELGEIESALNTHPQIQQAVVIAREDIPGNKRLVAYLVTSDELLTSNQLREFLKQKLPEYMVPSAFVTLDTLPLTPNGKVDRKTLPAPDGEITREDEYVVPRTEIEQTLTNIWQELLLFEKVSIHDNFFEIGGDSILSIQVVSRAKNSGIQITPKQIFQNQTIAELASVANTTASVSAQQGIVTGVAPLTPIQHWFFAQNLSEAHHYNQSFLLQIPNHLQTELIETALKKLLEHHDALRLRFSSVASEYKQINQGLDDTVPFTVVDLGSTPRLSQPQALAKIATKFKASFNLSSGPIMQVVMFNLGRESDARLLIIIHHLAVDGVSWRILLSDLETIYQQIIAQQPIQLSAKTTAFIDWAEKLNNYAQSEIVKQELNYWLNQTWSKTTPLPLDYAHSNPENTVGSAAQVSVKLSVEETRALLGSVNEAYNTQINDLLLSALGVSLAEWTGNSAILIDLEGHGREELFSDVDLSRTVGWFTSLFPVLLQLPSDEQPASVLKSIKEQLRSIPNRGIGYGILRYLCEDTTVNQQLQTIPTPEISFNYLG